MEKVKSWEIRKHHHHHHHHHHLGPKLHDFVGCLHCILLMAIDPEICWGPKSSMKQRIHSAGGAVQTSVVACIFIRKANRSLRLDSYETDAEKRLCSNLAVFFEEILKLFSGFEANFWYTLITFWISNWNRVQKQQQKMDLWGSVWSESQESWSTRMAWGMECLDGKKTPAKSANVVAKVCFCWHVLTVDINFYEWKESEYFVFC